MERSFRGVLIFFLLVGASSSAWAFDCTKGYLPVDFIICSDPAVLKANEGHEKVWNDARVRLNEVERQELLADQRRWLKEFPPRCDIPAQGRPLTVISRDKKLCVEMALAERAVFLERYQNRAVQSPIHRTAQPNKPQYARINQVDFFNFTYPAGNCSNPPPDARKTVTLKDGRFYRKFREGELQYAIDKNDVAFGDITGSPTGEATIALRCNFMANFWTTTIYVYTLRDGIPTLLAKFPDPSDWGIVTISAHNGSVVIEGLMDEPHACPKSIGRFTYTWNGSKFVLAGNPIKRRNPKC